MAVAGYFLAHYSSRAKGTRSSAADILGVFATFLKERFQKRAPITSISDIDGSTINVFEKWLDAGIGDNGVKWSKLTKTQRYNSVSRLFEYLKRSKLYAQRVSQTIDFNKNPWPRAHVDVKPRGGLTPIQLAKVRKACIHSVSETIERLTCGHEASKIHVDTLPLREDRTAVPYRDVSIQMAALIHRYNGRIASREELIEVDPGLARSMIKPNGTRAEAASNLHFTAKSIVPFVLLITADGAFNAEGVLTLEWNHIEDRHPIFGDSRWRIGAEKNRSGERQYRSSPSSVAAITSSVNLLKSIKRLTMYTRIHIPTVFQNRVFIYWNSRGSQFSSFDGIDGASGDGNWVLALRSFIRENDLPEFTLSSLRKSAANIIDDISGGDIKAKQVALGHASPSVTLRHYDGSTEKARRKEALATMILIRQRYIETGGRADTRGARLKEGRNSAATPGFGCVEPLFSPLPGQRPGHPCNAYGMCADCPLSWVNQQDPKSYIRLVQLRQQIIDARISIHPERWLKVWQPQLAAIERYWLPRFKQSLIECAASIALPPLPDLE